jgi:Protein of unknown function (DUF3489)
MTTITQAQAELLGRAAADADGYVYGDDDAKLAKALIKQGLAIWLPVEDGGGNRLICTEAGRAALAPAAGDKPNTGNAPAQADNAEDEPGRVAADPPPTASKHLPKGKLAVVIALLKRPEGASVEDMMTATGWQAHSVRGAMSGALKKKLGLAIDSAKTETGRVYRIDLR